MARSNDVPCDNQQGHTLLHFRVPIICNVVEDAKAFLIVFSACTVCTQGLAVYMTHKLPVVLQ